ncbi:MAG: hypothetical protein HYY93_10030 [Planctomycetes bacterium]|nr:hypothetical protein [Planctomycetota bacterium]
MSRSAYREVRGSIRCRRAVLAVVAAVLFANPASTGADDLSSAGYKTTLTTSAGSGSAVDATNATCDSASYRNLFTVAQPAATTNQQQTSASYRDSLGRLYLIWGLGTKDSEWIGTSDAGVETTTNWSNAFNWGWGVPTATRDALVPAARAYPALTASAAAKSLTLKNLSAGPQPSLTSGATGWNLDLEGDCTLETSTTLDFTGSTGTISLTGNWVNAGTFTPGSSTVTFDGAGAQNIQGTPVAEIFYNLTMGKSGSTLRLDRLLAGTDLTISNDFSMAGTAGTFYPNQAALNGNAVTVGRDLLISTTELQFNNDSAVISVARDLVMTGGTLTMNSANDTLNVARNWDSDAGGTFAGAGGSDVVMNGSSAQAIQMAAGQSFPVLQINNSGGAGGTVTAQTNVQVGDDLILVEGIYVAGGFTTAVTDRLEGQAGSTLRMNNAADLVDVTGNFEWQASAVEDISTGLLTCAANFTLTAAASNFTPTGGEVRFDGAGVTALSNSGTLSFYDLTILKDDGATDNESLVTTGSSFAVKHNFVNGLSDAADTYKDDFVASAGTITLDGTSDGRIWEYDTGRIRFFNLIVSKTNAMVTTNQSLHVNGALTVQGSGGWSHLVIGGDTTRPWNDGETGPASTTVNADGILTVGMSVTPAWLSPTINGNGVVNYAWNAQTEVQGAVQGFPVAAFDNFTGVFYAIYAMSRDWNGAGTSDRIYVLDTNGNPTYAEDVPQANGDVVGRVRNYTETDWYNQDGDADFTEKIHVVYVGTTTGKVFKYWDSGTDLVPYVGGSWTGGVTVGTAVTSAMQVVTVTTDPLLVFGARDGGNAPGMMVWRMHEGDGAGEGFFAQTNTEVKTAPSPVVISGTRYAFVGSDSVGVTAGQVYRVNITAEETAPTMTHSAALFHVRGAPTVRNAGALGLTLTVGDSEGKVHRLSNLTGSPWTDQGDVLLGAAVYGGAFPIAGGVGDRVAMGTDGGRIFIIKTQDGTPVGRDTDQDNSGTVTGGDGYLAVGGTNGIRTNPLVSGGWVYVGNEGGRALGMSQALLEDGTLGNVTVSEAYFGYGAGSLARITTVAGLPGSRIMVGTSNGMVCIMSSTPTGW